MALTDLSAEKEWNMGHTFKLTLRMLLVLSLVPGASVGMLVGLLASDTKSTEQRVPDAALIGALVGMVASLLAYNLYLQWPGLRGKQGGPAATECVSSRRLTTKRRRSACTNRSRRWIP